MKLNKKLLVYASFSIIPIAGGIASSAIITKNTKDFFESLPYLLISTPIFIASTTLPIFLYFRNFLYMYIAIVYSAFIPFIVSFGVSKAYENYTVEINDHYELGLDDHYIEVTLNIPVSYAPSSLLEEDQILDPNSLFKKLFNRALKTKLRRSPYYPKLRFIELEKCSSLKMSILQDKIILKKKCGDVIIEIILNSNKNPKLANSTT
ncbi:hypothetical protein DFR86_08225 [Acidianus sulfidivorans JP7]|uniref:Uncharacterized protein n=1 Tax=Acidianus sulfidivorans JP7 TaxID=619593 RepID=A0A2U9IN94_9CREN|nr:hypothetical protein [Acidianus sulfidivorans]AWR97539.1 hypothetical protein DFR86_08225 [Acidianus sulfidivorans JP7]